MNRGGLPPPPPPPHSWGGGDPPPRRRIQRFEAGGGGRFPRRRRNGGGGPPPQALGDVDSCIVVLKAIASKFIPETCNMEFAVAHSDDKIVGRLVGRRVSFDVTEGRRFGLANKKNKTYPGLDIIDTFMVLTDAIRRPSKCGFSKQATNAFHTLCRLVQAEVELSRGDPMWDQANALALPPLGSTRARRTPLVVKQAGAAIAAKTPTITSVGQIVASQGVLDEAEGGNSRAGGKRRRSSAVVDPRTCGTWMIANCTQHILQSRADASKADVFGIVLDGGQIGRRKSTVFLGFNPSTKIGTYGALQDRLAFAIVLNPNRDLSVGYVPSSLEPQNLFQKYKIVLFWNGSKRVGLCCFGMDFR